MRFSFGEEMRRVILAAHQPLFFPWLGYFDKLRRADVFVIVDHVQFERGDFQNRNRVLTASGVRWLTVPVKQRSRSELIRDKELAPKTGRTTWSEQIAGTLRHAYARAPFFDRYMPAIEDALARSWTKLADLDEYFIRFFQRELEIETPVVRSSWLRGIEGARTEMIMSLCRALGASVYLSGAGGSRDYLDVPFLDANGVSVAWQDFAHPRYPQVRSSDGEFVANLSVVDLLFNCGPASAAVLRGEGRLPALPRAAALAGEAPA